MEPSHPSRPTGASGPRIPVTFLAGPSHIIRWKRHVEKKIVRCGLSPERMKGIPGAPIWSKSLFTECLAKNSPSERFALMVGDFRFGNAILQSNSPFQPLMQDGFVGIDGGSITLDDDANMLRKGLEALQSWHEQFGNRVTYVFWWLFARQVLDRLAGKHIVNNAYSHPTWTFQKVQSQLPGLDVVDFTPLLKMPMHDVARLFIDSSCHPSQIGYLMLDRILTGGTDVRSAYLSAVQEVEGEMLSLALDLLDEIRRPILITGRSVWLDTWVRYIGASAQKFESMGLYVAPLSHPRIMKRVAMEIPTNCEVRVFSAGGTSLSQELAEAFGRLNQVNWNTLEHIDWESSAESIIESRNEVTQFRHASKPGHLADPIRRISTEDAMLELGKEGIPSWLGLIKVLKDLSEKEISHPAPASPATINGPGYRIEGDVLVTDKNVAFLIGGQHSVLDFASGNTRPSEESITSFKENIQSRVAMTERLGVPYAHIIFPDKQSVLDEEFPISPIVRLGSIYRDALDEKLKERVIYPWERLKTKPGMYLPFDTHLTDHGSLEVLGVILEKLGIEAADTLDRIAQCIHKSVRTSGDLGSKFNPPLTQEALRLDKSWKSHDFTSPGEFNDGMVDILIHPTATIDKTILLFGDSFFRIMLNHLSAVFSRVIFLRTRFYHREMVELIEPDIILSGNVERYLSFVTPDKEAVAFSLYSQFKNAGDLTKDPQFLRAYRAMTSPRSDYSRKFHERMKNT